MNLLKRLLSLALCLVTVLGVVPVQAFATEQCDDAVVTEAAPVAEVCTEHTPAESEEVPALCDTDGMTAGTYCTVCGTTLSGRTPIAASGHQIVKYDAKAPTYTNPGWEAYEACIRCAYSTRVEIPALGAPVISDYMTFLVNLMYLEQIADVYVVENPGKDPVDLVIKYIRTGVERYNSGSWGIMAGYEDAEFAKFVSKMEDQINESVSEEERIMVSGLKNLENITLPNGDVVDMGHLFGTMDITYHNSFSTNHADVAGWCGDLVDLLEFTDKSGVTGTVEEMVAEISENYLLQTPPEASIPGMNQMDVYGDLDALYIMDHLKNTEYHVEENSLFMLFYTYFTENLTDEMRADYYIRNRMSGISTRMELRTAVYDAYIGNRVISTLEGTREFTSADLDSLRKACCYAFADYICKLAGDYVENTENLVYEEFSCETSVLAPGITQQIKMANSKIDGKQMVYYLVTADVTRDDVHVYTNYKDATPPDPDTDWDKVNNMQRVLDQANAAQAKYGDPESPEYIENYTVIASVNGTGFNMDNGKPAGLLVMDGVEYSAIDSKGFFGITKDGTPVIGTTKEYNEIYKGQLQEGIGGFGDIIVNQGQIVPSDGSDRASRTAVGITRTGKVVFLVLDGRQEPFSCGGGLKDLAQILQDAGCVQAINLDGGGSTTYVARQPGSDELVEVNRTSDGTGRSVATSMLVVSTAPSSTKFDHAIVEPATKYITLGSSMQVTATGQSATGNTVDIPEGATWAVSNARWGTITEDGIFTAKRAGSVNIYLMLGEEVIGTETIEIVTPNNLYFTKTAIDTVYGSTVELPLKLLYNGKEVTFNENDIVFTLSNSKAGTVEGLSLICNSDENCGVKSVTVTAALAADETVAAATTISLYKQGEMSFDFDQATGGDRGLAWYREVSNATEGDNSYTVIDPAQDMVTSYTLAIDMTQLTVPAKLEDLTHMLPGADKPDASAWTFLLDLAARISPMSEITASVKFDEDMDVDISGLTLVNEYFSLTRVEVDEETNTVTMYLNWKKQTAAINKDTANPLCIVSGLKLTPKADADWGSKNRLDVLHSGTVSYKIYMKASALYSFSQNEQNQKVYGLLPYVNPDDETDRGGGFADTYRTFEDSYSMFRALKEGWVNETDGYAYYVNGVRTTGISQVEGLYYNFGENGICEGKKPYTGKITENGALYYAQAGKLATGWTTIGADYYFFNTGNFKAHTGTSKIGGRTYTFDSEGKLIRGEFVKTADGTRYYWAGTFLVSRWIELPEGIYRADQKGYICFGNYPVIEAGREACTWWAFDENGIRQGICNGFITREDQLYYCENGKTFYGAVQTPDGIVYCGTNGKVYVNSACYVGSNLESTAGLENGYYWAGADGLIVKDGFVTISGNTYHFTDYVRARGFTMIDGKYYFFNTGNGAMAKNATMWVSGSNPYGVAGGYYDFQADGSMYVPDPNGEKKIISEGGKLYLTIDGVKQKNGLNELDGSYYFANTSGILAVDTVVYMSKFNDLMTPGNGFFYFDVEGKLVKTGFVEATNGYTYYYNDLVRAKGFTMIDGKYYFFNTGSGAMFKNTTVWVSGSNPYGIVGGYYTFLADGSMYVPDPNGEKKIETIDGKLCLTIDGVKQTNGLNELDGEYYYANANGALAVDTVVYISKFNDLIAPGNGYFAFDSEGKLVKTGFVTGTNGYTYYYNDLVRAKGFTMIDGKYYFFNTGSGAMFKDTTLWVSGSNPYGIVGGYYTFLADGSMYVPDPNGEKKIETIDGKLCLTIDGVKQTNGLNELDGEYYYANANGALAVDTVVYISKFNDLIAPGNGYFAFDSEGKLVKTGFVTGTNGYTYYYNDLVRAKGLTKIGEDYYFFNAGSGAMQCGVTLWVSGSNPYGLTAGYYAFGADGKMA